MLCSENTSCPESQLPSSTQEPSGLPLPAPCSGNFPGSQLKQFCRAHFICFLSFRKNLENHYLVYFVQFSSLLLFGKFRQGSKSDTSYYILAASRRCINILEEFSYRLPNCSSVNKWQSSWIQFMYLPWPFFIKAVSVWQMANITTCGPLNHHWNAMHFYLFIRHSHFLFGGLYCSWSLSYLL